MTQKMLAQALYIQQPAIASTRIVTPVTFCAEAL